MYVQEVQPDARSLLPKLFLTQVKLDPPTNGPAYMAHWEQLQHDEAKMKGARNYELLKSLVQGK